jgi:hypothetical protein
MRFGKRLGFALQKLDDFGSVRCERRRDKGCEDLILGRPTWVWAELAELLPEAAFAALQQQQRAVTESQGAHQLLGVIADALDERPILRVSQDLDEAYATLCNEVSPSPWLESIRRDIERLRKAYV